MTLRNYEFEPWNDDGTLGQGVETETVFRFTETGLEVSEADLVRRDAGLELVRFAKTVHKKRGGTFSDCLTVTMEMHPKTTLQYLTGLES